MRVSQHQAVAVYQRPVEAVVPIVERREAASRSDAPTARRDSATEVSLSPEAKEMTAHLADVGSTHEASSCETCQATSSSKLSDDEERQVDKLKARDAEVRRHEQAHVAAAGAHANGGPHYDMQRGPDGKQYAVGGHVNIDTAPVEGDPRATIEKAEVIRRAALAPAEPSGQDRRVAAKASAMAAKARRELASQSAPVEDTHETAEARQEHPENRAARPHPIARSSQALGGYARNAARTN